LPEPDLSWTELSKILTAFGAILWPAAILYALYLVRESLPEAVRRLSGFEVVGVKLAMSDSKQAMLNAFELAEKNRKWSAQATDAEKERALNKAKSRLGVYDGAEILWVDDLPSNNRNESRMLRNFGAHIAFACSTNEALEAIKTGKDEGKPFDLVISDISRPPDNEAGLTMLKAFRAKGIALPFIFYIGQTPEDGVPEGAFGVINRPDLLLTMVGDALARWGRG
jgi:CheY-like chemotaxis protein